jgi:hypothetical protein
VKEFRDVTPFAVETLDFAFVVEMSLLLLGALLLPLVTPVALFSARNGMLTRGMPFRLLARKIGLFSNYWSQRPFAR